MFSMDLEEVLVKNQELKVKYDEYALQKKNDHFYFLKAIFYFRLTAEAAEIQGFLESELKKRNEKIDEMENELRNLTIILDSSKSQNKTLLNEKENDKVLYI